MIVKNLVTNAIYKSLQDRQFQPDINAGYEDFAVNELNFVLDEWKDFIPFSQELTFNNVANLSNTRFVSVSNVNIILNGTQTPLREVTLTQFNEIQNVLGLTGVPQIYYFDELQQSILVYPTPFGFQYSFTVWGRLSQQPLQLSDTIPFNMPAFMQQAMIYELAYRLCNEFGTPWADSKEATRQQLLTHLQTKKDLDLSPQRQIEFGRPGSQGIPPFPYYYFLSGGN